MGMYTEIYINVDLKEETPDDVIDVLKALCRFTGYELDTAKYPERWYSLFSNCSYYTPSTNCRSLVYDDIRSGWSLLGKGDIKNYANEIEKFFEWIMPWIEGHPGDFVGYSRYEEDQIPTLIFLDSSPAQLQEMRRKDIKKLLENEQTRNEILEGAVDFICKVEGLRK